MISTSGLVAAILNSGNQPTSGNVGSVRNVSSIVANVGYGVAVGIVSPCSLRSIVISTSGFRGRHFEFGRWSTSGNVGQCRQCHTQVGPGRKCGGRS